MASADLRDELLCSICLSIFTDPVTLRCGHNFCRVCMDEFLKTQDRAGVYSCPECRAVFQERPALQRNVTLHNVAERIQSTQPNQEEITGIRCTYCIHSPVPAVKSCLLCEASLCDNHLRVHSKAAEHVLTEPSANLEDRKCSVHKKILEYYCTEDAACICVYCSAGHHRGHQVEMLDEASERKKEKLRNVLQKLTTKREKTEERVRSLEERWRKDQEKASGEVERVTALFIDIRRHLDHLEKRVLREISRQEELMSLSLSDVIQKLEVKKDELSRKMRHMEELCNMTDPWTVLQEPDTGDLCDPEEEGGEEAVGGHDGGDGDTRGPDGGEEAISGPDRGDGDTRGPDGSEEDTGGPDGGDGDTRGHDKTYDVDVDGITRMLHAGIADLTKYLQTISHTKPKMLRTQPHSIRSPPRRTQGLPSSGTEYGGDGVTVRTGGVGGKVMATGGAGIYGQGPADILLDVNTAGYNLRISDDLKTATWTKISQNRPETSERFQEYPQVMSRRGFSSGRHYWDVEIRRSRRWAVGMCYSSIDRRGDQSDIGCNNKSWCLYGEWGHNNQYSVIHDSKNIQLRHQISSDRVRICLDYEAGQLSFYELCDPIRHLHTFTATFTEPLHAVLWVYRGYIKVSG
ncbi:E3 ubiquitin/ISG15 ligase TRIM25-like isoform X2 [Eleutherodactylus coqui]|uniref:E3 ubiquitin/ISG15 ligase TRIM25-like isoform X2 n=1 Tax=Eleutherodactylus coqui TaxID=57060 RepID=UPI00346202D6